MDIGARARLRAAHVASRYNPRLDAAALAGGAVLKDDPDHAQLSALCAAFQVPEWYWGAEDRTVIEAGAALPLTGLEPIADVTAADLVWLAFIERHQKRDPTATLSDLVAERLGPGRGTYRRFMQAAYDGMRTMRTMERASEVLDVPVTYWMIRDLDAARAVAAGTKTIGVIDAA